MDYIIQNFIRNVTKKIKNKDFSDLVEVISNESNKFTKEFIRYILHQMDKEIRESKARKQYWDIERYDTRTIHTELGKVTFTRTYYKHKTKKKGQRYKYLLDEALNIKKYQRLDVKLEAKLIDFSNEMSYEKAGELAFDFNSYSKQTVKNKVMKFSKKELPDKDVKSKKKVKYLYIDTDEDHPSMQTGPSKLNKIIYVYEGKIRESKNRNFLKNKRTFASFEKTGEDLWLEVVNYLYKNYDLDYVKKIFIQGDGAIWIKKGIEWLDKSVHVLDQFHLNKATVILSGGRNKKYKKLKKAIYEEIDDKEEFLRVSREILSEEKDEKRFERKNKKRNYIINQWPGIKTYIKEKRKHKLGCSAEGHVSHVLASRMSSRPMGWSQKGIEAMTKLRIRKENGMTRKEIKKLLKIIDKEETKKYRLKHKKRIKKKTGEMLGNIPAVNFGKRNAIYKMMSGIKYS